MTRVPPESAAMMTTRNSWLRGAQESLGAAAMEHSPDRFRHELPDVAALLSAGLDDRQERLDEATAGTALCSKTQLRQITPCRKARSEALFVGCTPS